MNHATTCQFSNKLSRALSFFAIFLVLLGCESKASLGGVVILRLSDGPQTDRDSSSFSGELDAIVTIPNLEIRVPASTSPLPVEISIGIPSENNPVPGVLPESSIDQTPTHVIVEQKQGDDSATESQPGSSIGYIYSEVIERSASVGGVVALIVSISPEGTPSYFFIPSQMIRIIDGDPVGIASGVSDPVTVQFAVYERNCWIVLYPANALIPPAFGSVLDDRLRIEQYQNWPASPVGSSGAETNSGTGSSSSGGSIGGSAGASNETSGSSSGGKSTAAHDSNSSSGIAGGGASTTYPTIIDKVAPNFEGVLHFAFQLRSSGAGAPATDGMMDSGIFYQEMSANNDLSSLQTVSSGETHDALAFAVDANGTPHFSVAESGATRFVHRYLDGIWRTEVVGVYSNIAPGLFSHAGFDRMMKPRIAYVDTNFFGSDPGTWGAYTWANDGSAYVKSRMRFFTSGGEMGIQHIQQLMMASYSNDTMVSLFGGGGGPFDPASGGLRSETSTTWHSSNPMQGLFGTGAVLECGRTANLKWTDLKIDSAGAIHGLFYCIDANGDPLLFHASDESGTFKYQYVAKLSKDAVNNQAASGTVATFLAKATIKLYVDSAGTTYVMFPDGQGISLTNYNNRKVAQNDKVRLYKKALNGSTFSGEFVALPSTRTTHYVQAMDFLVDASGVLHAVYMWSENNVTNPIEPNVQPAPTDFYGKISYLNYQSGRWSERVLKSWRSYRPDRAENTTSIPFVAIQYRR